MQGSVSLFRLIGRRRVCRAWFQDLVGRRTGSPPYLHSGPVTAPAFWARLPVCILGSAIPFFPPRRNGLTDPRVCCVFVRQNNPISFTHSKETSTSVSIFLPIKINFIIIVKSEKILFPRLFITRSQNIIRMGIWDFRIWFYIFLKG